MKIIGLIISFFFFLNEKETKNQEQTIPPHMQHDIAFVQSQRSTLINILSNN